MKQRYTNVDLFRIIACFFVLFVHCMSTIYYHLPFKSSEWAVVNMYCATGRNTVPLFLMFSGMLILSKEEYSLKNLFTKAIPRMILIFVLWSAFYAVDSVGFGNVIRNFDAKALLNNFLNFKYHLWYLPAMVSVYWMVPLFRAIRDNRKLLQYLAVMFVIFGVVNTTLSVVPSLNPVRQYITRFEFSFANSCGYFLLGYVLYCSRDKFRLSNLALAAIVVGVTVAAAAVNYILCVNKNGFSETIYDVFSIPSFLQACAAFLLCLRISPEKLDAGINKSGWIQRIARYSLFIYLAHPFVIDCLEKRLGIDATFIHPILGVPIMAVCVFAICTAAAFVIDLIPGVRKILL